MRDDFSTSDDAPLRVSQFNPWEDMNRPDLRDYFEAELLQFDYRHDSFESLLAKAYDEMPEDSPRISEGQRAALRSLYTEAVSALRRKEGEQRDPCPPEDESE